MRKKGFTLIELLAVIIILGVIALITTPIVMSSINDAKKNSFKNSAYGVIKSINLKTMALSRKKIYPPFRIDITSGVLDYEGDAPEEGWAEVDEDGKITLYMRTGSYWAVKEPDQDVVVVTTENPEQQKAKMQEIARNREIEEITNENYDNVIISYVPATSTDTHLGIIYLDPTDLTKVCSTSEAENNKQGKDFEGNTTLTGTKTGCMKWYLYSNNGTTAKAILDHNTTGIVIYNHSNENHMGTEAYEIKEAFETDVEDWNPVLKADLITANEVAKIARVGSGTFNESTTPSSEMFYFGSNGSNNSAIGQYSWLFDYTDCSACNIGDSRNYIYYSSVENTSFSSIYGYWTKSKVCNIGLSEPQHDTLVWGVSNFGYLGGSSAYSIGRGVRPVITVNTSWLSD